MECVTLKDLAAEIGMDRSHLRRYVLKLGIEPLRVRTEDSQNQLTLAVSPQDADKVRENRSAEGYTGRAVEAENIGSFYIIQLIPDVRPGRVKFGFAVDIQRRLSAHRTVAPTAQIATTWRCKREWESTVIDALSNGAEWVGGEVFQVDDMNVVIDKGNRLFDLLLR